MPKVELKHARTTVKEPSAAAEDLCTQLGAAVPKLVTLFASRDRDHGVVRQALDQEQQPPVRNAVLIQELTQFHKRGLLGKLRKSLSGCRPTCNCVVCHMGQEHHSL